MKDQKNSIWLLRILCWIAFLGIPVFSSPDFSTDFHFIRVRPFQREFLTYFLLLLFFYANYLVLLPQFYFNKRYLLYAFCLVAGFVLTTFLPLWLVPGHGYRSSELHYVHHSFPPQVFVKRGAYAGFRQLAGQYFFQFLVIVVFSFALRLNTRWKQSEKARVDAELGYLKARINPHFLFNTLNSIYALAIEKSEHTAAALVQLSGLMRYSITESAKNFVPLSQELNYIRDYIALIRIRLDKDVQLQFEIIGEIEEEEIAPMLLITFIENAFKYGVNPDEPSFISIRITVQGNRISLMTRNRKVTRDTTGWVNNKTGIRNVQERLNYIYPHRHTLEILDEEQDFWIFLSIFMA
jgi:ABC-type multidrug transport system fused ATPase/permease subunit